VATPGPGAVVNALAPDGVVEAWSIRATASRSASSGTPNTPSTRATPRSSAPSSAARAGMSDADDDLPDDRPGTQPGTATGPRASEDREVLARAGIASRRDAEKLIADGKVKLNGKVVATPATFVAPGDRLSVAGKPVAAAERTRLFRYHKPDGLVTTHRDPQGRPTVFDKLPAALPRVVSVGRLDITSEGLLLLTNDGALARRLELPANGWLRRYRVAGARHGRRTCAGETWRAGSPWTASPMARSRPGSTAARAPMPG
jgi:hypothetical protein